MPTAALPATDATTQEPQPEPTAESLFEAEARACAERPLRRAGATYRLQVNGSFRLDDVTAIVPYLDALGITDCYLSPYLDARPGSTHGYDVFDHSRINPEIGDDAAHARLTGALAARGMGRVLDIVPNHMGIGSRNRFWVDVLETGPQARSAKFFDIDWKPVKDELEGRVLLPILEDLYGKVLEAGRLVLERDGGSFWIRYHEQLLPLNPRSYLRVLDQKADDFAQRFDQGDDDVREFLSIRHSIVYLPPRGSEATADVEHVRREKEIIKGRLARLVEESPRLGAFLDESVAAFQGTPGIPSSFEPMHLLLEEQVYRLAFWRVASEEINYRRFFDVTELAGLRTEDPEIFEIIHALIFRWVDEGGVTGLRIDHPDGLADPLGYFRRLQEDLFVRACRRRAETEGQGGAWDRLENPLRARYRATLEGEPSGPLARRFPVVAEKILSRGESLPPDWPIDGTVGYEYLNALNGLFVDPAGETPLDSTYREFTGDTVPFAEVLHESKALIESALLASELTTLTRQLSRVAGHDRYSRDFSLNALRAALHEVMACFQVYRTYIRPGEPASNRDQDVIEQAVARARRRLPEIDDSVFAFVRDVLLLRYPPSLAAPNRARWDQFATRFQQTTGPVQAKGLEDTAFYRQVRLGSLNEVGGDPTRFGMSPSFFHALNVQRLDDWPGGLSTTATHDTKRGEDARIRINVLSELPDEWRTHLARWARWNARKKGEFQGRPVPDAVEEHLLYQTLVGAWPCESPDEAAPEGLIERIQAYMLKAIREAKRNTSWTDPDPTYAEAVGKYVGEILGGSDAGPFLKDFIAFQRRVARVGVVHSLAQTLLKLVSPGVPDLYQGCELWDFNLVDPDNRRPVDYEARRNLLDEMTRSLDGGETRAALARRLFANPDDGAIKLYLIWTVLNHRRAHQALYQGGIYRPLEASGDRAGNVVALLRRREGQSVLAVAPRLVAPLMGDDGTRTPLGGEIWGDSRLILPDVAAASCWRNLLTDRTIEVRAEDDRRTLDLGAVFEDVPAALLVESV